MKKTRPTTHLSGVRANRIATLINDMIVAERMRGQHERLGNYDNQLDWEQRMRKAALDLIEEGIPVIGYRNPEDKT